MDDGLEHPLIGNSPTIQSLMNLVKQVAVSDCTILISGESGVGKELIARSIHNASLRADGPYVIIDCATLSESLLESELFGHERGAYTGANIRKHGLFEVADSGTVFLDEVGETSLNIQAKLLRVLETGTFRRVGGNQSRQVDVRMVAATNRNLEDCVKQGKFRQDLFFRLNVIPIQVPPLRERPDDIPLLVQYFIDAFQACDFPKKEISEQALNHLLNYDWPGNIRELKNVIERAVVICRTHQIMPQDLPKRLCLKSQMIIDEKKGYWYTLEEAERYYIAEVLEAVEGHRGRAAKILGISQRQLYRKIKRHAL